MKQVIVAPCAALIDHRFADGAFRHISLGLLVGRVVVVAMQLTAGSLIWGFCYAGASYGEGSATATVENEHNLHRVWERQFMLNGESGQMGTREEICHSPRIFE